MKTLGIIIALIILSGITCSAEENHYNWSGRIIYYATMGGTAENEDGSRIFHHELWNIQSTKAIMTELVDEPFRWNITASPDQNHFVYYDINKNTMHILDKDLKEQYKIAEVAHSFNWSADGTYILYGKYFDGIYRLDMDGNKKKLLTTKYRTYDHNPVQTKDGEWTYFFHHEYSQSCTLYRIKTKLLLAGSDWKDCEVMMEFETTRDNEEVGLFPLDNGNFIMSYSDNLGVFNPSSKIFKEIAKPVIFNSGSVLSPDGKTLAKPSALDISLIDTRSWKIVKVSKTLLGDSLCWAPDSKSIAMDNSDGNIVVWDLTEDKFFDIFRRSAPNPVVNIPLYGDDTFYSRGSCIIWTK